MMKSRIILALSLAFATLDALSQIDGLLVETYYVSDINDATDTDGGELTEGSVTYRVFLDMSSGYSLKKIFGSGSDTLKILSSELIFNNEDRGEVFPTDIGDNRLDENTVALDSWITMGMANESYWGIPKAEDPDGSIVGGINNDGGSESIASGLLVNNDASAGAALTTSDGLISTNGQGVELQVFFGASDLEATLNNENSSIPLYTNEVDISTFDFSSVPGVTNDNHVLLAQITTVGELELCLNVELEDPDGMTVRRVCDSTSIDYDPFLRFPITQACSCQDPDYLEFDPMSVCEDNSLCQTLAVLGCGDPNACNFDPLVNISIPQLCCFTPDSCGELDFDLICGPLSVQESLLASANIYPMPASDALFIEIGEIDPADPVQIRLFDLNGRELRSEQMIQAPFELPISDLPNGSYLLTLEYENGLFERIVVKH